MFYFKHLKRPPKALHDFMFGTNIKIIRFRFKKSLFVPIIVKSVTLKTEHKKLIVTFQIKHNH